ncbi:MAG TPA: MFS transporter [Ferruginibacter sp.]|jgi:UMF1 family MFS transporter|nr:MFS transporter [Ferruginibacter sp.]MBN8698274.1 MFS transporter [Chitinophagales bacterium]HMX36784.1 MFS transporter [Ferruginibacter sp.]HNA16170.1 MFS transporter [Ferruginibacter sp.]HNJ94131.1 MFS transporter [Ferruginibacter sp.]
MQTASKKVVNGWAMYDWANSVYNLVITTTFFPAYYAAVTGLKNFPDGISFLGRRFVNTELKDYVLAFGFLIIALLSPVLSSIADYKGNKKNFMRFFCYLGAASCSIMFFFDIDHVTLGLLCFMFAGIGFYGSQVFYNSYLPEIAAESDRDRISAKGYSFGYIGSVLMQLVGFALVMLMSDKGLALRITFLLVGIWWVGFAQITFTRLPISPKNERKAKKHVLVNGFHELQAVWQQVKKMPVLKRYLTAFFFYSMGVQTVMLVAIDFGIKELKLPDDRLIITAVIIQLVAIAGAIAMSRLSAIYGNIRVLIFTVLLWIGVCITGYYISTEVHFYILASLVGMVMGGIQSLSRSTYSKLMPETRDTASFFSFYDVTEKFAIVIGLFTFGFIEGISSIRQSILSLVVFFILGLLFLLITSSTQKRQGS